MSARNIIILVFCIALPVRAMDLLRGAQSLWTFGNNYIIKPTATVFDFGKSIATDRWSLLAATAGAAAVYYGGQDTKAGGAVVIGLLVARYAWLQYSANLTKLEQNSQEALAQLDRANKKLAMLETQATQHHLKQMASHEITQRQLEEVRATQKDFNNVLNENKKIVTNISATMATKEKIDKVHADLTRLIDINTKTIAEVHELIQQSDASIKHDLQEVLTKVEENTKILADNSAQLRAQEERLAEQGQRIAEVGTATQRIEASIEQGIKPELTKLSDTVTDGQNRILALLTGGSKQTNVSFSADNLPPTYQESQRATATFPEKGSATFRPTRGSQAVGNSPQGVGLAGILNS